MSVLKYIKAFIVISFMFLTVNAFSFINKTNLLSRHYLEKVFSNEIRVNLIAEDIQYLDTKSHINSSLDRLTLQIYLSSLAQQSNAFTPNSEIEFLRQLGNYTFLADFYQILAISSAYNDDLENSYRYFLKAFQAYQISSDKRNTAIISQNLSWIDFIKNNLETSISYIEKAQIFNREILNKRGLFRNVIWENEVLLAQKKSVQVENKILRMQLIMSGNDKGRLWECYYQLGKSYLMQQKYVQAKWFFVQALTLSESFKIHTPKIKSLLMLAKAKSRTKDFDLAIRDIKVANNLLEGNNPFKIDVAKQFAETYSRLGNLDKANYYESLYTDLSKNYVR